MPDTAPVACILIIGNEILSGRTQDVNVQFIARRLAARGIRLAEVRMIPDVRDVIMRAVNECRAAFDLVFTTGGIGPTHDDITSECVAQAFGVPWEPHAEAWALMAADYAGRTPPVAFNAARQRMATMPRGASLIRNAMSVAPGFRIGNVFVLAGVPRVMQAMFDALEPDLPGATPIVMRAVHAPGLMEGDIAASLTDVQARYADVDLGSYPYYRSTGGGVAVVAKGQDAARADDAIAEVSAAVTELGLRAVPGEPP
jgi:molybdenum cofactor synthesis domain-containing protein